MLRQVLQVVLLMALLTTFAVSSIPAFAQPTCSCFDCPLGFCKKVRLGGECKFDKKTSQCVNVSCDTYCY
jgi:hypothetical protein